MKFSHGQRVKKYIVTVILIFLQNSFLIIYFKFVIFFKFLVPFSFKVSADEPSELSTTSTESTVGSTIHVDRDIPDAPLEEQHVSIVRRMPEFVRPLVSRMELPEGGVAK